MTEPAVASERKRLVGGGRIQVYTGNGKGKTTAAFGLSLRMLGAGMRVFFGQFVKGMHYSELDAVSMLGDAFKLRQYGRACFIRRTPEQADIDAARNGLEEMRAVLASGEYDLVVLDEANIAMFYGLFTVDELLECIRERPAHVEVLVTGRKAPEKLLAAADLVTDMGEVKHYFETEKLPARQGIEM